MTIGRWSRKMTIGRWNRKMDGEKDEDLKMETEDEEKDEDLKVE